MIEFSRNGSTVVARVDSGTTVKDSVWCFRYECHDEDTAEIVKKHFATRLQGVVKSIREEAYMEGYMAGRAKRRKEDWFSGEL